MQVGYNKVYKYGISGQNFNTDGTHPRPKTQTDVLNALEGTIAGDASYTTIRRYKSEVILQNVSKLAAEFMEQEAVNAYYSTHGERPEGNKHPLPDPLKKRPRKKFDQIDQKVSPDKLNKIKDFLRKL